MKKQKKKPVKKQSVKKKRRTNPIDKNLRQGGKFIERGTQLIFTGAMLGVGLSLIPHPK